MRSPLLFALQLVVIAACGGKTEVTDRPVADASVADAEAGAETGAQDATPDASPWSECFMYDGTFADWTIKECMGGGSSCVVMQHQVNCCGTMLWVGIAAEKQALFDTCEAAWRAQLPECGCATQPTTTEQPKTAVPDYAGVDVGCMNCTMDSCVCMTFPKN